MGQELKPAGFRWFRHVQLGRARKPADMIVKRPDGSLYDIRRSLGLGPRTAPDPMADDAPGWRPAP